MATGDPGDDVLSPDIEDIIQELARLATTKMAVGMVAEVVSYNHLTQRCDARPVVKLQFKDAGSENYPACVIVTGKLLNDVFNVW